MPTDLEALCSTCKMFCTLATPRLYHQIKLRTWHDDDVERFFLSYAAGASACLHHTRTLIIEDDMPKIEPFAKELPSYFMKEKDLVRDRTVELLILLFPRDQLRSFRLV